MYLKLCSEENLPDASNCKGYTLIECCEVLFFRRTRDQSAEMYPYVMVDGIEMALVGNAYVLNESGKTIDSFSYSGAPARSEPVAPSTHP